MNIRNQLYNQCQIHTEHNTRTQTSVIAQELYTNSCCQQQEWNWIKYCTWNKYYKLLKKFWFSFSFSVTTYEDHNNYSNDKNEINKNNINMITNSKNLYY